MPRGYSERRSLTRLEVLVPAVMIVLALAHLLGVRHELEAQVAGRADRGTDAAGLAALERLRRDAELGVGEQHHRGVAVGDRLDLADEPGAVDDRLVDADAVARALVDLEVWYQELGERAITRA